MPRPHPVNPKKKTAHVIQAVKNFAAIPGVCHIGLGVTATNNMKTLRRAGWNVEAWAIQKTAELHNRLKQAESAPGDPITHVIVSAPWIPPERFKQFCIDFSNIEFVFLSHSGCAFLSIDKFGMRNIREYIDLELQIHNFHVAANNTRVTNWISRAFGAPCLYLPNLYDVTTFVDPYPTHKEIGGTLRLGSFGAGRPWKNQLTAAEAAVQLARQLGVHLELYVNSKRPDGGQRMIESREELFDNLRGCNIVEVPWETWAKFRHTVGTMHLLLQPSFDETFNVVTADGIAAGVASVTASSIEWTPRRWWATPEDPSDLVRAALQLLHDTNAVADGRNHLRKYVQDGLIQWANYLAPKP